MKWCLVPCKVQLLTALERFAAVLIALTATAVSAQSISMDKTSGTNGTYINVTTSGFALNSGAWVEFNGEFVGQCPRGPDIPEEKWFNCTTQIRAKAPMGATGPFVVRAANSIGQTASQLFTVTRPLLAARPSCAVPGERVDVTGQGFAVGTPPRSSLPETEQEPVKPCPFRGESA